MNRRSFIGDSIITRRARCQLVNFQRGVTSIFPLSPARARASAAIAQRLLDDGWAWTASILAACVNSAAAFRAVSSI